MAQYCKMKCISLSGLLKPEYQECVMRRYGFRDWESVQAAIGHGGLKEGQVVNRLQEEQKKQRKQQISDGEVLNSVAGGKERVQVAKNKNGIVVKGIDDVTVRFSRCCNPIPGDEIVGYVTRGRGVSIHRTDCINMLNLPEIERMRLIEAEWQSKEKTREGVYGAEIRIFADNRVGLIVDISKVFTEKGIDISSINTRTGKNGIATIDVVFGISSRSALNEVIEKLNQVESVLDIQRTSN
jgi:GTP pyrophosphokinase